MAKMDECYQILGIDPGATLEEVEEAYAELAQVWGPERFPNDDHIRQMAERKMIEIDAARATLLRVLGSRGEAAARNDQEALRLNRTCETPRCTGVLDGNGICSECGKFSAPNFRYTVFCSACGTRNVIASQRDYDRGICTGCRKPLSVPVKIERKSSRKTAYAILLVVIFALVWFFFSSGTPQDHSPKKHSLNAEASKPSAGISANKVVEPPLAEPEAHRVEPTLNARTSVPAADQLTTSGHSSKSTTEAPPEQVSSGNTSNVRKIPVEKTSGTPAEENRSRQPDEQTAPILNAGGKESKPVEQAGQISAAAPKDAKPVEVTPNRTDETGKENFDRLIDEIAQKKATRTKERTGQLRDLPFDKLNR